MDLNRIKKNIQSRKWESKSMKTNIGYIKKQLKQFGLSAPKYLTTNKKLTQNQIQTQTKRIIREIEKQQDIARRQASIPSMSNAMKNLKKRDRQILEERFMIGKTQMEIASELGISQAQISRIEKNAIKTLKKNIKKKNTKNDFHYMIRLI